jgi:hypothetical protein
MAKSAKKAATKKSSNKRTTIAPNGDKRYIKRNEKGQIKESDDVGKSLSQDVKQSAKNKVKPGYGDQGDQPQKKPATKKAAAKKK